MSRIGKKLITIPKGVIVKIFDGAVEVQGPKGKLRQPFPTAINFELSDGHLIARPGSEDPGIGKFHGLARSFVANAVTGVTAGFKKELDIVGVGYRAEVKGKQVVFALGYSHPVVFAIPTGIDIAIEKQTHITVTGVTNGFKRELDIVGVGYRAEVKGKQVIFALGYSHAVVFDIPAGIDIAIEKQTHISVTGVDRQLVGQVAANIRRFRKPDPYKQKGVRYTGEVLKKKAGKTGAK